MPYKEPSVLHIRTIQASFSACKSQEEIYQIIMGWAKQLPPFNPKWKIDENLVSGCQSIMYLHGEMREGKIYFAAASDALISAGLAAIMLEAYNGQTPETILKVPPSFLEELGISTSLTPGRANGLASLYLKMKQEALRLMLPG